MAKVKQNTAINLLTISDTFTWGFYTIATILTGIYLAEKLNIDVVRTVGIGVAIKEIISALTMQIFGRLNDKIESKDDEIIVLMIGNILIGLPFILFPLINVPPQFYILQIISGIGTGMALVSWRKSFAKNLEDGKEGEEYGNYGTIMAIVNACLSLLAGLVANINQKYFNIMLIIIGLTMMAGSLWLVPLLKKKSKV